MNRKQKMNGKQKMIYMIVMLQSIFAAAVFTYSQIIKWELIEKLTMFLYPIYKGILLLYVCISFIISLVYLLKKVKDYKIKSVYPLMIIIIIIILTNIFFNESKLRKYNYEKYKDEREMIVEQVMTGERTFDETGNLELGDFNEKIIAPDSQIYLISNGEIMGIYFCTFSGLLDSSSGYLYKVDANRQWKTYPCDFDIKVKFDSNWYYISTY